MSDPHDERLTLPIEQGVLLWCMRAWVGEMRRPAGLEPRIHDLLGRFGVPQAAGAMQRLMSALSRHAVRMIDVQCVCCTRVGADERALLDMLGLAQDMRPFEALLLLHGLVTPAGARAAFRRTAAALPSRTTRPRFCRCAGSRRPIRRENADAGD